MLTLFDILLFFIAFGICVTGVAQSRAVWRQGRPENRPGSVAAILSYLISHKKILSKTAPGIAHLLIFWGFVFNIAIVILAQFDITLPQIVARALALIADTIGIAMLARHILPRPSSQKPATDRLCRSGCSIFGYYRDYSQRVSGCRGAPSTCVRKQPLVVTGGNDAVVYFARIPGVHARCHQNSLLCRSSPHCAYSRSPCCAMSLQRPSIFTTNITIPFQRYHLSRWTKRLQGYKRFKTSPGSSSWTWRPVPCVAAAKRFVPHHEPVSHCRPIKSCALSLTISVSIV